MKIKKFLIAGGNSTELVYNCPIAEREKTAKKRLQNVEQIGFISTKATLPMLTMMGEELCINATLAFASTLEKTGKLATSGLQSPVSYTNKKESTTILLPLQLEKHNNIILVDGIGFVLYDAKEKAEIKKSELSKLSKQYKLPAFGGIIYKQNKITPYVYVAAINSFTKETACGSGSIAFHIFSGVNAIVQPTEEIICVKKRANCFTITAKVTACK